MDGEDDGPITLEAAVRIRLEQDLGEVLYGDLRAHLERDAVFVVAATLSLLECAVSVALDDVDSVRPWLESQELRKPSRGEREAWPAAPGRRWRAVVVRPFVLVQELAEPSTLH